MLLWTFLEWLLVYTNMFMGIHLTAEFLDHWEHVPLTQWDCSPNCTNLVLLPGKSHGRRSLVGCSPWGCEESDMTEQLHFHFSLLCIGEGNGNPLQCSCLENPRDGVAQSRTRLKWLSSSSSIVPSAFNEFPLFHTFINTWYYHFFQWVHSDILLWFYFAFPNF